ncbi:hypothetical protein AWB78_02586 [Caballeronia calidae]|uniref:EamA-like transporter family protein n=2 Tax=Caballeronia calidae TaxID=1777139 RepID=A0A158BE25_9BURK|nr:hypothetical protein AWB78_02586 [Caballeronia calidae]
MATIDRVADAPLRGGAAGSGILIMIGATAVFAACDTTVKLIGATVPLLILLFLRYVCQAVLLGLWQARHDVWTLFRTKNIKLQMLSSALLLRARLIKTSKRQACVDRGIGGNVDAALFAFDDQLSSSFCVSARFRSGRLR